MKTTNKFIIAVSSIFCYSFCKAQQTHHVHTSGTQWVALHKKELSTTAYVFEGNLIQESWREGTMLTCYVLKITKIYKGSPEIKIGTIKVMAEHNPRTKDGWKGLSKGSTYIIFGRSDSDKFYSIPSNNPLALWCVDYATLSGNTARWGGIVYNAVDSVYSFFKENGVMLQEEQK